ncbi:unnamed protein product [Mytilus coruscus]|uniref:Uncharacterized protein n=1 Tax=Mytilus coruscus TaxID=42192 RepID=A0A6J8ASW9_MYTCO|nr:unnamed protein product [Mytilus coruscus]
MFIFNCKFSVNESSTDRFISDSECLPNGLVIVACYNLLGTQFEVMAFSVIGEKTHVMRLEKYPKRMVVVDQNTVAVFLINNSVAIVDIQQNHVKYLRDIAKNQSLGSFICIENQFYVGDELGITVIDMSGDINRRIKLSFVPHEMCYDVNSQRVYCINSDYSKLIGIDRDGTIIFTFADPNWTKLKSLTIDNDGNVLVLRTNAVHDLGSVIKVDSNGKTSDVVITNIQLSEFNLNSCICFHHSTNSVVIGVHSTVYIYKKKMKSVNI